jgi:hypothetical protein
MAARHAAQGETMPFRSAQKPQTAARGRGAAKGLPWFHWACYAAGALVVGLAQVAWLQTHGWAQAPVRLPLSLLLGAIILGPLLGLAARHAKGVLGLALRQAAYLLGLDRKAGRRAWVFCLILVMLAGGAASYWWWVRPMLGAQKIRAYFIEHAHGEARGLLTLYYPDLARVKPKEASLASGQLAFPKASDFPGGKNLHFVVRWLGVIEIPKDGVYGFGGQVDDGLVLLIDGRPIAADWNEAPPREVWGSVALAKGRHALDISYSQVAGGATLQVFWQPPGTGRSLLPLDRVRPLHPGTHLAPITRLRLEYGMLPWRGSTYPPFRGGRFWRVPWYGLQY